MRTMTTKSLLTVAFCALGITSVTWASGSQTGTASLAGGSPLEPVRHAYGEGRYQEALVLADRALSEGAVLPVAIAELHFWRGASLRRLGRPDEALVALDSARREGFRSPELSLERALVLKSLGRTQESEQEYREAERRIEEDPDRRVRFGEEWRRAHAKEPAFRFTITPQVGFDTNVIGLDKDAPLLEDDLERDSLYGGAVLLAKYYLVKSDERMIALEARSEERVYASEPDLDYTDSTVSISGRFPLYETLAFEVRGALGEAWVKGDGHARTVRSAGPALVWRPDSTWQVRLFGDRAGLAYYDAEIPAPQDRDGTLERVGIVVGIDLGKGWSAGPMASYGRYDADGADFDSRDLTVGAGVTTGEVLGCVVSATLAHTRADYRNPNSLTGFAEKREDRILSVTVTVTLRKLEEWIGYAPALAVGFANHGSNVDAYDYDRWDPRVEVGIAALTF